MPNEPLRLSRRAALTTAALIPGAVVLAGCDDDPSGSGTPGAAKNSESGRPAEETPSTDPVVVAALATAAAQVTQLSLRYTSVGQKFPALRARLASGAKYHANHLARLKETAGVQPPAAGKLPALPSTSAAALADLAKREQAAAVAHAAAAAKLSGEHARLLAMIAAAETQLAISLTPKKKADSR
ncbi:cell division protein FtsK [Kribbella swartbergensis]